MNQRYIVSNIEVYARRRNLSIGNAERGRIASDIKRMIESNPEYLAAVVERGGAALHDIIPTWKSDGWNVTQLRFDITIEAAGESDTHNRKPGTKMPRSPW